jgi:hypothetical protein
MVVAAVSMSLSKCGTTPRLLCLRRFDPNAGCVSEAIRKFNCPGRDIGNELEDARLGGTWKQADVWEAEFVSNLPDLLVRLVLVIVHDVDSRVW